MAAAAITPRSLETAFMPAIFPGVSFTVEPPRADRPLERLRIEVQSCRERLGPRTTGQKILNESRGTREGLRFTTARLLLSRPGGEVLCRIRDLRRRITCPRLIRRMKSIQE